MLHFHLTTSCCDCLLACWTLCSATFLKNNPEKTTAKQILKKTNKKLYKVQTGTINVELSHHTLDRLHASFSKGKPLV